MSNYHGQGRQQLSMRKGEPLLSQYLFEKTEPSFNYVHIYVPGYQKKRKRKKKTRQEQKNKQRKSPYSHVCCWKITSTLGLLVRGHPQDEGLPVFQPCALGSKVDYFYAITLAPFFIPLTTLTHL